MPSSPRKNKKDANLSNEQKLNFRGRIKGMIVEETEPTIKITIEKMDYTKIKARIGSDQLERLVAVLFKNQLIGIFETELRKQEYWLTKIAVQTEEIW
ncbi:MAG: hypothetical protein AAFV80_19790 [Bacteroidota bacterium]